jgi:copper(I)-binding protein
MPLTKIAPSLALAGALLLAAQAHAQVSVQDAWVRASVPQQKATGAFMRLTAAQDTRLVAVSSPLAAVAEVHEMKMEGDVMKMRAIRLMDLKQPAAAGSTVPLTLVLEGKDGQRQSLEVQAPVRALGAGPASGHDAHGGHGSHRH